MTGQILGSDRVRFTRHFPAPIERLWAYLTQSDLLSEWLGSGEIALAPGGRVELRSGGPVILGTVVACEPPRRLAYTWVPFVPGDPTPMAAEAIVAFALDSEGEGTQLELTQGPIAAELLARTAAGWHALLDTLAAAVAGEAPPDFVETFRRVLPEYEKQAG